MTLKIGETSAVSPIFLFYHSLLLKIANWLFSNNLRKFYLCTNNAYMKYIYLSLLVTFFTLPLLGQEIILKYGEINYTVEYGVYTYSAKDTITNNTANAREFRWVRNVNDLPEGWVTGICDVNTCHNVNTSHMTFTLGAYESAELGPMFFPADPFSTDPLPHGLGIVEIYVYALDNEDVNATTTINFEISPPVSTKNLETLNLKVYPNPATDFISIQGITHPVDMAVYNFTGQRVMEERRLTNTSELVSIQQLPQGIYFVKITSKQGLTKTLRFFKP